MLVKKLIKIKTVDDYTDFFIEENLENKLKEDLSLFLDNWIDENYPNIDKSKFIIFVSE